MAKKSGGKQRTRGHVIADLAFNHVERQILRCGFTMNRVNQDYGLDAIVRTYSDVGFIESGIVWVQLKSSDAVRRRVGSTSIAVRVERRDLLSWYGESYPVILVLYDGKRDRAHWLHVQPELSGGRVFSLSQQGASVTLHLDSDQLVSEESVREWRTLKDTSVEEW